MSFSSLLGSGLIPRDYGIIGITTEGVNPIPLATNTGTPVIVLSKYLTGLPSKFYVINYTMIIHNISQPTPNTGLTLKLQGLDYILYNMLDDVILAQDEVKEINLTQILEIENGTGNITLAYEATIPSGSTATYDFKAIISYEPIDVYFVPPPV